MAKLICCKREDVHRVRERVYEVCLVLSHVEIALGICEHTAAVERIALEV